MSSSRTWVRILNEKIITTEIQSSFSKKTISWKRPFHFFIFDEKNLIDDETNSSFGRKRLTNFYTLLRLSNVFKMQSVITRNDPEEIDRYFKSGISLSDSEISQAINLSIETSNLTFLRYLFRNVDSKTSSRIVASKIRSLVEKGQDDILVLCLLNLKENSFDFIPFFYGQDQLYRFFFQKAYTIPSSISLMNELIPGCLNRQIGNETPIEIAILEDSRSAVLLQDLGANLLLPYADGSYLRDKIEPHVFQQFITSAEMDVESCEAIGCDDTFLKAMLSSVTL